MNNPRLTKKKQVQILVALTLLAWATQTLMHQWGFGQEVAPEITPAIDATADMPGSEKFVPGNANSSPSGTARSSARTQPSPADVTLKQLCRWSDGDASVFTPIADLTVYHLPTGVAFQAVTLDQVRQTLHDAGVNIAMINFAERHRLQHHAVRRPIVQPANRRTVARYPAAPNAQGRSRGLYRNQVRSELSRPSRPAHGRFEPAPQHPRRQAADFVQRAG